VLYGYCMSESESLAEEELERLNASAFDASGVDVTQIDWMLSLTPLERLSALYETATSLARLLNHADCD
jgi:hypothetical protein